MRILFEILLFVVLALFFAALALVFYKWLSNKFFTGTDEHEKDKTQLNENGGDKNERDR